MSNLLYSDVETCGFYDLEHPWNPQDPDVRFYSGLCRETRGPILELACGNGRLLVPILRAGADIEGLDVSRPMLSALRERLRRENLRTAIHEQSMDAFRTDRRYDLIFIAATSFQILDTREAQVACLRRCRDHLAPGGRVVLDFALPKSDAAEERGVPRLFRRFEADGRRVSLYQTIEREPGSPRETALYRYEIHGPDGALERTLLRALPWRRLTVDELRDTARRADFPRVELLGAFDLRPLTTRDREIVAFLGPNSAGSSSRTTGSERSGARIHARKSH